MTDQAEHKPTERQRAVIDAVCGLANALLCTWGRGAGATWTRQRIAERILSDDGGLDEERAAQEALEAHYGRTSSGRAELEGRPT